MKWTMIAIAQQSSMRKRLLKFNEVAENVSYVINDNNNVLHAEKKKPLSKYEIPERCASSRFGCECCEQYVYVCTTTTDCTPVLDSHDDFLVTLKY